MIMLHSMIYSLHIVYFVFPPLFLDIGYMSLVILFQHDLLHLQVLVSVLTWQCNDIKLSRRYVDCSSGPIMSFSP